MTKAVVTKTVVNFPYGGYTSGSERERHFWQIVDLCLGVDAKPVVILNRDTELKKKASAFLANSRIGEIDLLPVWAVDTCQMWLAGWGYVLDGFKKVDRIVQLPGDIDTVPEVEQRTFSSNLKGFIKATADFVIGDFKSKDRYNAKELIDTYGTYPLLSNWFPDVAQSIQALPLTKPRSEFINIDAKVLKDLLLQRKFAYEQTLNMLIRLHNPNRRPRWNCDIIVHQLGAMEDDKTFRRYRDCLDQIERTERVLKLLWREMNEPKQTQDPAKDEDEYKKFSEEYDKRDRVSTNMRETARQTIRTLLGA